MKIVLNVVGIVLLLLGLVFFLQGLNVLLGSPMSGQPQWVIIGGILVIIGLGLFWFANRRKT